MPAETSPVSYRPSRGYAYIAFVVALGGFLIAYALRFWTCDYPFLYFGFLATALATSALKVSLPGIKGTLSVAYIFVLFSLTQFTFPETVLLGISTALAQSLWKPKQRVRAVEIFFNVSSIAIAVGAARLVYDPPFTSVWSLVAPSLRLLVAAGAYFLVNTLSVAIAISLTTNKDIREVWKESHLWSLPYYLLGASIVVAARYFVPRFGLQIPILTAPVIYGVYKFFRIYIRYLEDEKKHAQEVVAMHERTIAVLEASRKKAEEAGRLKSEFLANMSHEVRTPMNGIIGMIELAADTKEESERNEYLETARGCAHSLMRILNDILDLSKIEAGKLAFERVRFSVPELLGEIGRSFQPAADEKRLSLVSYVSPDMPNAVVGDPVRLRQVLVNLIGNAVKFTPKGGVKIQAGIEPGFEDRLLFVVSDTGIGISKDEQERIFQPFVQADGSTTRQYGGTGLGLAIASQLVEMTGGRIWVESEPGRGSTFQFTWRVERYVRDREPFALDTAGASLPPEAVGLIS